MSVRCSACRSQAALAASIVGAPVMFLPSVNGPAAAVPAGHKPRHSTMRPGNAVAPSPEVGVVDADRPRQQAHAGSLPPLCLAPPGGAQGGSSVPALFCVATNLTPEDAGLCLSERSCGQHVEAPPPQKILARIFGVQRSSVKLVDRTSCGQWSTTQEKSSPRPPLGRAAWTLL